MVEDPEHLIRVNAWVERARGLPTAQLCRAFETAFGGMWGRALLTLGEVTLGAIFERVRFNATEALPCLAGIEADAAGIRSQKLASSCGSVAPGELAKGFGFILLEFVSVLGNLTAQILTPALHAELSRATEQLPATVPLPGLHRTASGRNDGEGSKS
jgi:hypothetical protein